MTESYVREDICRIGRSLFERGYVHSTAGSISVRLDDGLLMSPTDACLGFLDPARLARFDAEGRQTQGDRASKTHSIHSRIYGAAARFDRSTGCVIHTHSSHCVALTLQRLDEELLPALTPYFVMKVGHVPIIPYNRPGAQGLADAVAQEIQRYGARGTPLRAVMLARLGPIVWHDTPSAAMAVLEELEETAKLALLTHGRAATLDEAHIGELRETFGARW